MCGQHRRSATRRAGRGRWSRCTCTTTARAATGRSTTARDQVVALLDRQWIDGAGYVRRVGGADDQRDPKLNNAALVRVDFEVIS